MDQAESGVVPRQLEQRRVEVRVRVGRAEQVAVLEQLSLTR